jgi:glycosyltransferase involved in cell wall biosynthesis
LRVALLFGAPPQDVSHLKALSSLVELVVYASSWDPARGSGLSLPHDAPYRTRMFRPVLRSRGGHLHYVYRGLRRCISEDRLDVLHVYPEPWGLLAQQAARACRKSGPVLVLHGCDNIWHHGSMLERAARRRLAQHALSKASAYAAENRDAIGLAQSNALPPGTPTAVIHTNPRSPSIFRIANGDERVERRRSLGVATDLPLVGFFGRTAAEKGIHNFIAAIELLNHRERKVEAVIAGEFDANSAQARARAIHAGIACPGAFNYPDDVAEHLRAVDVLCVPSIDTPTWKEQGPRIVIEAMLSGATVVGSDTPAIRDLLEGAGHLTTTAPQSIAEGIERAIDARRTGLVRIDAVRQQAIARFGPDAVARQLHSLWSECVRSARH